ncbi:TPA: hypothetical protein ACGN8S_005247 [Bacillus cereus]
MSKQQSIKLEIQGGRCINLKDSYSDINPIDIVSLDIAKEEANVDEFPFLKMGKGRKFTVRGERLHG